MPDKYYQEYGPIKRRRAAGTLHPEDAPPEPELLFEPEPLPDRPPPRSRRLPIGALLFLLCAGAVALALPYASNLFASGRAFDGVSLAGQPVGGQSRAAIRDLLEQRYADFRRAPATIVFEGRTWTPTLDQLGISFDLDGIADEALAAGHRGGPIERVEEIWALWRGGLDVAPRITVDGAKLQAYLSSLAPEVERPPRDAALSIAEGRPLPTPAQAGRQVLADATAIDILRSLQRLEPATIASTASDCLIRQPTWPSWVILSLPLRNATRGSALGESASCASISIALASRSRSTDTAMRPSSA